uniref:ASXL transcriptional regulator 1 n=1 Tax=Sander lucioperca TaxID=283035 RepID=A0A8D0AHY9_SANLU
IKPRHKQLRTEGWWEAAVLENFSDAPMTPKQILHVIQTKGLKEMRGTAPLACLVTMLHSQVRGDRVKNSIFFKLPGRMSLFTLKVHKPHPLKLSTTPAAGTAVAPVGPTEAAEQESCDSTETTAAASGDNDGNVYTRDETVHLSIPLFVLLQSGRQRKKAVMMPRVVLTPLKVNGEHVPQGKRDTLLYSNESKNSEMLIIIIIPINIHWGFIQRSRGGVDVDFETPGSILVNTNIRALINVRTFSAFPTHSQQQLLQLLPEVDRQIGPDGMARLSSSALNNEFFTHASQSWKERLAEGEFTHEMQVRFRQEMEKEKKVEAWKEKFFEEYHGQKSGLTQEESLKLTMSEASEVAASVLDSDVAVVATGAPKRRSVGRRRRDGRMRRRTRADLRRRARRTLCKATPPAMQPAEAAEARAALDIPAVSVGSPMSDNTVVQDEVVLQSECGVELPAESAAVQPEPSPTPDRESSPSASPTATPVPSAQPKEQKRRPDETQAFSSFPEKRPRLDDRQSFRTTIDSVRSEKPQPTTEEPKVPPIRIQLSRIKPPWVKGHPTYQICPRIVPPGEGSRRSGTGGARTLADIKAHSH